MLGFKENKFNPGRTGVLFFVNFRRGLHSLTVLNGLVMFFPHSRNCDHFSFHSSDGWRFHSLDVVVFVNKRQRLSIHPHDVSSFEQMSDCVLCSALGKFTRIQCFFGVLDFENGAG